MVSENAREFLVLSDKCLSDRRSTEKVYQEPLHQRSGYQRDVYQIDAYQIKRTQKSEDMKRIFVIFRRWFGLSDKAYQIDLLWNFFKQVSLTYDHNREKYGLILDITIEISNNILKKVTGQESVQPSQMEAGGSLMELRKQIFNAERIIYKKKPPHLPNKIYDICYNDYKNHNNHNYSN